MWNHDLIPYDQALEEGLGIELGMKLASVSSEQTNMLPCLGGGEGGRQSISNATGPLQ